MDKVVEIGELLYQRTKKGEIVWERTDSDTRFLTSFPNNGVVLRLDATGFPQLLLRNERGETIETLSFQQAVGAGIHEKMRELYELARRQAFGVDQALDELLRALKAEDEKK
jgi:hypothetical protein